MLSVMFLACQYFTTILLNNEIKGYASTLPPDVFSIRNKALTVQAFSLIVPASFRIVAG